MLNFCHFNYDCDVIYQMFLKVRKIPYTEHGHMCKRFLFRWQRGSSNICL